MRRATLMMAAAAGVFTALSLASPALDVYLRAEALTKTMPDGAVVTFWGYAQDTAFGAGDGALKVPGPRIVVPPGDPTLTIHLDNNLPVATSVVVLGQRGNYTPSRFTAGDPDYSNRIRSLTSETASGNAADSVYTFGPLEPGPYLYLSGTHQAVQVQMGLYGAMTQDALAGNVAYPGLLPYDVEAVLLFSEVDSAMHQTVAAGNYGPPAGPGRVTSPIDYHPEYFLINGQPYDPLHAELSDIAGGVSQRMHLRVLNAGLETRVPVIHNAYWDVVAQDGNPLPHVRTLYSYELVALRTFDAVVTTPADPAARFPIYDRRLGLFNGLQSPGGGMAFIATAGCGAAPTAVGASLMESRVPAGIHFTWGDVPGATTYRLYQDTVASGAFTTVVGASSSGTTGLDIALPAAPLVFYKIAAANCGGESSK